MNVAKLLIKLWKMYGKEYGTQRYLRLLSLITCKITTLCLERDFFSCYVAELISRNAQLFLPQMEECLKVIKFWLDNLSPSSFNFENHDQLENDHSWKSFKNVHAHILILIDLPRFKTSRHHLVSRKKV